MTTEALAKLGQEMRAAQRQYFRFPSARALETAKAREKLFDRACRDAIEQPGWFDPDREAR